MHINSLVLPVILAIISIKCRNNSFPESSETKERGCFEFYSLANLGYCSFLSNDFESSIHYYSKAFELRSEGCNASDYRNDHYFFTKALIKKGRYSEARETLQSSILYGELDWKNIIKDSILNIKHANKAIISKSEFDSIKSIRNSQMNLGLRKVIDSMVSKDRYYRLMANNILESKIDSIKELQLKIDAENERMFISIFKKYGFPGMSKIGTDDADILLMHMSLPNRKKLFPELLKEVDRGAINPDILGMMIDQELVFEGGGYQKYGYFIDRDEMYVNHFTPFKVNNLDSINKYRKEIGAISLECAAIKNNVKMPMTLDFIYVPKTNKSK